MGKCLSCYEDTEGTNHVNNSASSVEKQELTDGRTEVNGGFSSRTGNNKEGGGGEGFGGGGTDRSDSSQSTGAVDQNTNANNSVGGGRSSLPSSTVAEKRMFYPRIPPILSDSKKVTSGRGDSSDSKIMALFDQYKDPGEDALLSEGIEKLCQDLEVKPEEFKVLVLAWKFGAKTMCCFTRQEFLSGCKALKVNSIKGIQNKFPDMLQEVQDPEKFKDFYRFTFKFGLESDIGQRILPVDMAVGLWKLVFSQREPPILKRWLTFLEKHPNVRGIPRDTWNMFLNFCDAVGDDLSTYDDTEAWPSLFDDFVEYENDQTNQNVQYRREFKELE